MRVFYQAARGDVCSLCREVYLGVVVVVVVSCFWSGPHCRERHPTPFGKRSTHQRGMQTGKVNACHLILFSACPPGVLCLYVLRIFTREGLSSSPFPFLLCALTTMRCSFKMLRGFEAGEMRDHNAEPEITFHETMYQVHTAQPPSSMGDDVCLLLLLSTVVCVCVSW